MSRDDYETRDEAGAAAFERDNTWADEQPDLRDVLDEQQDTSTTTTEGHDHG